MLVACGGLVLYTFDTRFAAAIRSVAIFMIGGQTSHDIARLFPTIATMGALRVLLSGPLLSPAFHWGMKFGDAWLGMPLLLCGILFAWTLPLGSWKASGFPTRTSRAFLMNAVRRHNIATASSALLSLETSGKISNASCVTTQPEVTP